jgi:flagellar protein FliJ
MKARESVLRLKRFEVEEKSRKVADLQSMIHEFEQMASDLERQISSEESRTGVKDMNHFAYSTFAKAAAQRRDNLKTSVDDLRAKLDLALADLDTAREVLQKAEGGEPREAGRTRRRGDGTAHARAG